MHIQYKDVLLDKIEKLERSLEDYETRYKAIQEKAIIECKECNTYVDCKIFNELKDICLNCQASLEYDAAVDEWTSDYYADIKRGMN